MEAILSRNITLVYDSINLRHFDTSILKNLFEDKSNPAIVDTPEMIIAAFPELALVIQVGDRRIRITMQRETRDIEDFSIWEVASKTHLQVPPDKHSLVAYGFNFDVGLSVEGRDSKEFIVAAFLASETELAERLGGEITSFIPRIVYIRDGKKYDLVLEPLEDSRIKAHLNMHLDHTDLQLPASNELQAMYISEFAYLQEALERILQ